MMSDTIETISKECNLRKGREVHVDVVVLDVDLLIGRDVRKGESVVFNEFAGLPFLLNSWVIMQN